MAKIVFNPNEKSYLEEQIKLYNLRIKNNAKDYDAYYLKTVILLKLGANDQALLCVDQAMAINPEPIYYALKAQIYVEKGAYKQAKKALNQINIFQLSNDSRDKLTKNIILETQDKIQNLENILVEEIQEELKREIKFLQKENLIIRKKIEKIEDLLTNLVINKNNFSKDAETVDTLGDDA